MNTTLCVRGAFCKGRAAASQSNLRKLNCIAVIIQRGSATSGDVVSIKDQAERTSLFSQLGRSGFPYPNFDNLDTIITNIAGNELLLGCGINVIGGNACNTVLFDSTSTDYNINIDFGNVKENIIIIEKSSIIRSYISVQSNGGVFVFGGGEYHHLDVVAHGKGVGFYCGKGTYVGKATCWVLGSGADLLIGEDCMFGKNVDIRTGDGHGLFDVPTGTIINRPKTTVIEPHVWIGDNVMVMKGANIGSGSTIGAGSVVTGTIPKLCAAGGVPAKVIRERVSWSRSPIPSIEQIADIISRPYL